MIDQKLENQNETLRSGLTLFDDWKEAVFKFYYFPYICADGSLFCGFFGILHEPCFCAADY